MQKLTPKRRVLFVRRYIPALVLLFGVFSLLAINIRTPKLAEAATTNTINFQARLEAASGAIAPDGNYNVQFKLYSGSSCAPATGTGCTQVWSETYQNSNSQGVRVVNGYLTVGLGSVNAFSNANPAINWDQQLWLSMNIGGTSTGASPTFDGEMKPFLNLTAVPYAFSAGKLVTGNGTNTSSLSLVQPASGNQIFQLPDLGGTGTNTYTVLTNANGVQLQSGLGNPQTGNSAITGTAQAGQFSSTSTGVSYSGTGSLQLSGNSQPSYLMSALGLGTQSPQSGSALTIVNGQWISSTDASGTGFINMFEVNSNNQIQVGAALNVDGYIVLPTNGGQLTFSDLPIDATAVSGTPESYSLRVGSSNALTVYGEADGSGNAQNIRIAIGASITPQFTLDVGGDINTTGIYRRNGVAGTTTTCAAGNSLGGTVVSGGIITGGTCGAVAPASGSSFYIQNGSGLQTAASFNIDGTGAAANLNATTSIQINGTTRIDNNANIVNIGNITGTNNVTLQGGSNGNVTLQANGSGVLALATAGGTAISVNTTGNVGIGTTTPGSYKLNVNGSANATTVYQNGNQVCDTSGNCAGTGSGGIGGGGTANKIALFTGSGYNVGNSILSQDAGATTITTSGNAVVTGTINGLILNNSFTVNNDGAQHNYKIATLRTSSSSALDHLRLTATLNNGFLSNNNSYIDATFANRGGFYYQYSVHGALTTAQATLTAYNNGTTIDVYISLNGAGNFVVGSYSILENVQETLYANPADVGATPTGTLVFDASQQSTYLPYSAVRNTGATGIGTATPSQMLDVQGGSINTSNSIYTGGTERLDNTGALKNIASLTGQNNQALTIQAAGSGALNLMTSNPGGIINLNSTTANVNGALVVGSNSAQGDFVQFTDTFDTNGVNSSNWRSVNAVQNGGNVTLTGDGTNWTTNGINGVQGYRRTNTLTLSADVTPSSISTSTNLFMVGFSTSNTSVNISNMPHALYFNGANLRIYENSVSVNLTTYPITAGSTYRVRIAVSGSGARYYISNNGGSTWTFLYDGTGNGITSSPLYPLFTSRGTSPVTMDNVSVSNGQDVLTNSQLVDGNLTLGTGTLQSAAGSALNLQSGTGVININGAANVNGALIVGANSAQGDFVQFTDTFDGTTLNTSNWTATGSNVTQNGTLSVVGDGSSFNTNGVNSTQGYRRTNTLTLTTDVTTPATTSSFVVGFGNSSTSVSYTTMPHAINFNGSTIIIYENNVSRGVVMSGITASTTYRVRISVNATGARYYISSNGGSSWTLLYDGTANNITTSPLYVRLTNKNTGAAVLDNLSVSNGQDVLTNSQLTDGNSTIGGSLTVMNGASIQGATVFQGAAGNGGLYLQNGTAYGGTGGTVRNGSLISLIGSLSGRIINQNSDMLDGTTGYFGYDNSGGGHTTISSVANNTAPNDSGNVLQVNYDGNGTYASNPSPGYGGFRLGLTQCSGTNNSVNGYCYRQGNRYMVKVWANIPVGYTLVNTNNGFGTGSNYTWLTSTAGTGQWQEYDAIQTIGVGGTLSSILFFYLSGATGSAAFNWQVASVQVTGLDEAPSVQNATNLNVGYYQGANLGFGQLLTTQSSFLAVSGGSVGIGTTNPGQKLDVQGGNINTSGSIMTGGQTRLDGSGNLSNIGTISLSGSITASGNTGQLANFGSTSASTDMPYVSVSNGRASFGFDGANQNVAIQGNAGKGIEFNVNNNTFGSGTVLSISAAGNITTTGSITVGSNTVFNASGVLQNSALASSYGNAISFTNTGNTFYGSGANLTALNASNITTGTVSVANGGTGVNGATASNGQLLIGNGSGYSLATITPGTGISVSNTAGGITIASTGATGTAGGDLTGTYPNPTVAKLQGVTLTTSSVASGQVLSYNGTAWVNTTSTGITTTGILTSGSITSFGTINTGNTITGTTLNGTTGINTGAGSGTTRIDNLGNLSNIASYSGSGNITTSAGIISAQGTGNNVLKGSLNVGSAGQLGVDTSGNVTTSGTVSIQSGSSTAFAVQDVAANSILTINNGADTANLIANPGFESAGVASWVLKGASTLSRSTSYAYSGQASMQIITPATANAGVKYPVTLQPNTLYQMSFNIIAPTASGSNLAFGFSTDGSTEATYVKTGVSANTTWQHVYYSFTTPATVNASSYVFIKQTDATGRSFWVDNIEVDSKTLAGQPVSGGYSDTRISLGGNGSSITNLGIGTTTPNAAIEIDQKYGQQGFLLQGSGEGGNGSGLAAPLLFNVVNSYGISALSYSETVSSVAVQGGSSFWNTAALLVTPGATDSVGLRVRGISGQTGDLIQIQDYLGNNLLSMGATGDLNIAGVYKSGTTPGITTNCTTGGNTVLTNATVKGGIVTGGTCASVGATAVTLQNAYTNSGSSPVIALNSTGGGVLIQDATTSVGGNLFAVQSAGGTIPYFTVGTAGISVSGAVTTATIDYTGGSSINLFNSNNTHNVSIATSGSTTQTVNIGSNQNASQTQISGASSFAILNSSGVTLGTQDDPIVLQTYNSTNAINMGTVVKNSINNSTAAFQIQNTSGAALFNADTANNSVTISTPTASTTAFQVINAYGSPIFLVDTSTNPSGNLITNGGFEAGTTGALPTGWSTVVPSGSVSLTKNVTSPNHYGGLASGYLTMSGVVGQGISTSSFLTTPASSSSYTLSFYAQASSGVLNSGGYSISFNGGTASACTTGVTLNGNGFQRISCTATTPAATVTSVQILINTGGFATNVYIDSVQLVAGSTARAASGIGAIQLRGAVVAPVLFQAYSNSTTAFQIQNTAGTSNLFVADTLNNQLTLGGSVLASTINIGTTGTGTVASTTNIGNTTNGTSIQSTIIGSNANASNAVTIEAGNTGKIQIGNSTTAHTIQIGSGGTSGQTVSIGSVSTGSVTTLYGAPNTTTATNGVRIGTPDANQTNLVLDSSSTYAETANTCTTAINQGAMYYNSTAGAIRSCVNGAWEDVVTTSGLGIIAYGVIPDSTTTLNAGDIAGTAAYNSGPCRVYVTATASIVGWNSCSAYSQGRKILITAGTATVSSTTSVYQNLCVQSAGSQPTLGTANATETSAALPTFTVGTPALCLATIKTGTSASTVAAIYDTRVYTTDTKTFAAISTAQALGTVVKQTTTAGSYAPIAATTDMGIGVLVAYSGTTSTTTPNAVIVTSGPIALKATAATVGSALIYSATGGYVATGTISATAYTTFGVAQSAYSASTTACAASTACAGSIYTIFAPR